MVPPHSKCISQYCRAFVQFGLFLDLEVLLAIKRQVGPAVVDLTTPPSGNSPKHIVRPLYASPHNFSSQFQQSETAASSLAQLHPCLSCGETEIVDLVDEDNIRESLKKSKASKLYPILEEQRDTYDDALSAGQFSWLLDIQY